MVTTYTYSRIDAYLSVNLTVLEHQLDYYQIPGFAGGTVNDNTVEICFDSPLTTEHKTILDSVFSSHTGGHVPSGKILASAMIVSDLYNVKNVTEWEVIAGVVVRPNIFHSDMNEILPQLNGHYSAIGEGAEFRLVESQDVQPASNPNEIVMTQPPETLPDTVGLYKEIYKLGDVHPREGLFTYRLEARLNSATSLTFKYASLSIILVS